MTKATEKRNQLRAILNGDKCVHPGSVFDPISARLAEDIGYPLGILAGSVASLTVLGAPDHVVMTLTELADQCRRICRAGNLPLLVDADHGFGNALSVRRTIEELEVAGVAAMSIEDTALPRRFGQTEKLRLTTLEEGVGKIRAAIDARDDPAMVIVGRTSAPQVSTNDEAVRRLLAYENAGADALFVVGIKDEDDLRQITRAIHLPLILAHPGDALADLDLLGDCGVSICLQPHLPVAAAIQATYDMLKALYDGTSPSSADGGAGKELIGEVTRSTVYNEWMARYL